MVSMETATSLQQAIRDEIAAFGRVTIWRLQEMLEQHPEPALPDEKDLVIRDGILSVDLRECTCAASGWDAPEGCSHEHHCGLEPILDISLALERGGYRA